MSNSSRLAIRHSWGSQRALPFQINQRGSLCNARINAKYIDSYSQLVHNFSLAFFTIFASYNFHALQAETGNRKQVRRPKRLNCPRTLFGPQCVCFCFNANRVEYSLFTDDARNQWALQCHVWCPALHPHHNPCKQVEVTTVDSHIHPAGANHRRVFCLH